MPDDFRLVLVFFFLALPPLGVEVSREEGRDLLDGAVPVGERNESRLAWERDRLRDERAEGEGLGRVSTGTEDGPRSNCLTYTSCTEGKRELLSLPLTLDL